MSASYAEDDQHAKETELGKGKHTGPGGPSGGEEVQRSGTCLEAEKTPGTN